MADRNGDFDDPSVREFSRGHFGYVSDPAERVSSLSDAKTPDPGVKLVALYLPQFYPIPENDLWWGKGFTEWTNVARARPQFVGHYQPRLPADLGFYDLRLPGIQEQQVALAKKAGISAFCFYFYWFHGRTLLEAPIKSFAENKNIDFDFCLCWANENWSRTWSGNANNILLEQTYSEADDYAFIAHLAPYLRHERYLRIDGKPLINVWRSAMMPDPEATAGRWRAWCRDNGIGEIHISRSENYERIDPAEHGMDSAYHNSPCDTRWIAPNLARVTAPPPLLNPDFAGQLFDYADLVRHAREFKPLGYPVFRSVCPSWDNQARRPGAGRVLLGAEPGTYREYLETVVDQTAQSDALTDTKLVYINAWNEWGEGAHLEPDRRYGFAHLEATKMATLRVALRQTTIPEPRRVAVVIHAYYPEMLGECLDWIDDFDVPHDVFITTSEATQSEVERFVAQRQLSAQIYTTENRGRDIAPFVKVLQQLDFERYGYVLKLHTKATKPDTGDAWRRGLLGFLTEPRVLNRALDLFDQHPEIGVLGPADFLLSMRSYLGRNEPTVRRLAKRMGVVLDHVDTDTFFAGTMFLARTRALLPLAALGITVEDFEPEAGQRNGTMAHALERAISYSAKAAGLSLAAFEDVGPGRSAEPPRLVVDGRKTFRFIDERPLDVI